LLESGVDVLHLGLCGTEEIYHAAFSLENQELDGGIVVTASHNPADYNGLKFVTKGARPVTGEGGLKQMAELIVNDELPPLDKKRGTETAADNKSEYIQHLLGYVDLGELSPLKLVVNNGNGSAAPVVDLLEQELPFTFIKAFHKPDGTFPNGVPQSSAS